MKILFITPSFHHPTVRGPNHCYHFVKQLCSRHQISLLTLRRSAIAPAALEEVETYVEEMRIVDATVETPTTRMRGGTVAALSRKLRGQMRFRAAVREMKLLFMEMVSDEPYDLVLFHGKSIYSVIEDWNGLPIAIYACDATAMRYRDRMRWDGSAWKILLMGRYLYFSRIERKMLKKSPHVAFASARDRDASAGKGSGCRVVPIGVDVEFWQRRSRTPQRGCVVFTGVLSYGPNEDAALYLIEKIVPLVRPRVPGLEVLIVGREPTARLKKTASRHPNIVITGFVNDVRTYLERASLFVAPMRYGSGVQNKVLEALAMEVPVVCTSVVAAGLPMDGVREPPVCIADGAEEIARSVVQLLGDEEECARAAVRGRRYVKEKCIWSNSAILLEKMLCEATGTQVRQTTDS